MRPLLLALVLTGLVLAPVLAPISENAAAECVVINPDGTVWINPRCPTSHQAAAPRSHSVLP